MFLWTGGAMFVLSLAYCLWWYLFPLGADRPFAGSEAILWDATLLTIFACHHSLFARERIKSVLAPLVGDRLRSVYVWAASLLLLVVCLAWRPVGGTLFDVSGIAAVLCAAVQLIGVALIASSVRQIDPLELAGIRSGDGSPYKTRRPVPKTLQITGPYRFVRHPLYFGWILAAFATHHLTGDRLTFAVLTSLYLVIAVPWEERSLVREFGDAYTRYTAEVPWRVIPYVY